MSKNTAFQSSAFQWDPDLAFQIDIRGLTDTTVIKKPINAILAGQQDYEVGARIAERFPENYSANIVAEASERVRLSDKPSTFTVKSNNRGYD